MSHAVIRVLRAEEWPQLRSLRLRALEREPLAFGQTIEHARAQPDGWWVEWAAAAAVDDHRLLVASREDGELAAMCWTRLVEAGGRVSGMWVDEDQRRAGLGAALLVAAETWLRAGSATHVTLHVTAGNDAAERFYAAAGYVATGETVPLRADSDVLALELAKTL